MKFINTRFHTVVPLLWFAMVSLTLAAPAAVITSPTNLLLAPSETNPRNSEGDFIELKDGRILFVYTHFSSGSGDYAKAHLAGRFSKDRGVTWDQEDTVIVPHPGGINIMSVSLLRLQDGSIALLYLHKVDKDECIPMLLISTDEAQSWSKPTACITDPIGYYVVNNDRMIQLKSGRLIIPAARHLLKGETKFQRGIALCTLSDDGGKTWHMSKTMLEAPEDISSGLQEPAVLELLDGRILMLNRTSGGAQYRSFSDDQGETWSPVEKTALISPVSPATVERIPGRDDLLLVWNDHSDVDETRKGKRTPLRAAISQDDGQTWHVTKTLENLADGWYCYIAMDFVDDQVLLGYCSGDRREGNGLDTTKVTRIPLSDFYTNLASAPTLKESKKMLRHIVLFKFEDSAPKEEVQKILDAFVALEEKIDVIDAFEWGTNVSKEGLDKGLTHGFTLTFKTQEDLDSYINHPDHKAFVKLLDGKLADVCVFDYWAQY